MDVLNTEEGGWDAGFKRGEGGEEGEDLPGLGSH